jgi:hypothetical protein
MWENLIKTLFGVILVALSINSIADTGRLKCRWKIEETIPHLHKANDIWFENETGILLGYYSSLDDLLISDRNQRLAKREAIILRKNPLNDNTWLKVFSGDGEIFQISFDRNNSMLYGLGRSYSESGVQKSYLLVSKDFGKNWSNYPAPSDLLNGICFRSGSTSIVWSEESVYRARGNGISWEIIYTGTIFTKSRPKPLVSIDGNIIWIPENKKIIKKDKENREIHISLPNNFKLDLLQTGFDNVLWIAGRKKVDDDEFLFVYKLNQGKFILISQLGRYLANNFYVGKEQISIYCTDIYDKSLKKKLLFSNDNGRTWQIEKPLVANATGPTYYENEHVIWDVATRDRIQKRSCKR